MDAIPGYVALGLSIGGIIYSVINHKQIKSKCCGKVMEASLDIESTKS